MKGCQVSGSLNQLYHLPESKGYISQDYCVIEPDVTNALVQQNYKDEFGEVMSGTIKELEEYFYSIISSQQLNIHFQVGANTKLLFERIIEQSEQ